MATFTSAITLPNVNGFGLDLFEFDVNSFQDYLFSSFSSTLYRLFDDADNEVLFGGSGLVQDPVSGAITGIITSFVFRKAGVVQLSATGLNVDANVLQSAIETGDSYYFLSLLAAGSDTFTGTALNDNLWLAYNDGNDTMNGGDGNDLIYGGLSTDILNGQADSDYLVGGNGQDIIDGGSTFTNGENFDSVGYTEEYLFSSGTEGIIVNFSGVTQGALLNNQVSDAFGEIDTVTNIEEILGTGFDDIVYAPQNVSDFRFRGYSGSDTYFGSTTSFDVLDYHNDERFAVQANLQVGLALVASGITVNFSGDNVVDNGSSGTIVDSFGDTDTAVSVDQIRGTFFNDIYNGGIDKDYFYGLKGGDIFNGNGGFDISSYAQDLRGNDVQAGGLAGITANFTSDVVANGIAIGTVVDGFGNTDQLNSIEAIEGTDFNDVFNGGADRVEFWSRAGADTFNGGIADDYVDAGEGDDILNGGAGLDNLKGGDGTDIIYGGADNDNIRGDEGGNFNQGNDQLFGEGSDDSFKGGAGNDLIDGGADRDRVEYNLETTFTGDNATHGVIVNLSTTALINVSVVGIVSTTVAAGTAIDTRNYVDTLVSIEDVQGTGYDDIIVGGIERNNLEGNSGNDSLMGGLGGDDLKGGAGMDSVIGGSDNDFVSGGAGADILNGGTGGDDYDTAGYSFEYLWESGNQGIVFNMSGSTQNGVLTGTARDSYGDTDTVSNFEEVQGTGFADIVYANMLVNEQFHFKGYDGNDSFFGTATGRDRLDYSRDEQWVLNVQEAKSISLVAGGITVNFAGDVMSGNGASGTVIDSFGYTDTVSGVDVLRATFFVDTFNGGADDEEFQGLKGADIINGGGGGFDVAAYYNDQAGNDVQTGGLNGITANFSGDTNANGITVGTVVDGFGTTDQLTDIEAIDGTDFNDTMIGGADNIDFWGGRGNDTLTGGAGSDYIGGDDDGDTLAGGAGSDTVNGGAGQDVILVGNSLTGDFDVLDGGVDRDFLDLSGVTNGAIWIDYGYNVISGPNLASGFNLSMAVGEARVLNMDSMVGTGFGDIMRGDAGSNLIDGGAGDDTLLSYSPYDTLTPYSSLGDVMLGGIGNDLLFSGTGNDYLDGGANDDILEVGGGTDTVVTGNGQDTIFFSPRNGTDTVTDFTGGAGVVDVLKLYGFGTALDTYAEVFAVSSQQGADTHIALTDTTIILQNFTRATLVADDFVFV